MHIPRIYIPENLKAGSSIFLSTQASHHLSQVLRLKKGDEVHLFNGQGGEYQGSIVALKRNQVEIEIQAFITGDMESPLKIHLGQGISRGEKMDFTIEKSVELGVHKITPLLTERCGVKLSEARWQKRMQHWRGKIISACEQCGRNILPLIEPPQTVTQWLAHRAEDVKLLLHPLAVGSLVDITTTPKKVALLIGPEGGFSDDEIQFAQQNAFTALKFGPRVLRTETAAMAVITALQCRWGDVE